MRDLYRYCRRLRSERATVFLEYTLLFAFFALVICSPLIPGGPVYDFLHKELIFRVYMISLPLF